LLFMLKCCEKNTVRSLQVLLELFG
jgi:hypothetical protein